MITVLVADDQDVVRLGLRTLLEHEEGFGFAGEAADGLAAVAETQRRVPDVVLMDIRMPGIDGIEATRRVVEHSTARVIVLTTFEHDEYVVEALRAGASGFLLKDTSPKELLEAIRTVADGNSLLSPSVTRTLISEFVSAHPKSLRPHPNLEALTAREREVVSLAAEGLSNKEIGQRLFLSPDTARTHVSRAMIKLDARDRAQLVVFAYQSGLV